MPNSVLIAPPLSEHTEALQAIQEQGFAVLSAESVAAACHVEPRALSALLPSWDVLPVDQHLKDRGNYRKRSHASYTVTQDEAALQPHRAHWQSVDYNALHGGMERWFDPMQEAVAQSPAMMAVLQWLASLADGLYSTQIWFTEAHQFRIEASGGIGRPTPEGAHRDGVNLVAVFLINRYNVLGGETRVFHINDRFGQRFTLDQPWSVLLLDDQRVIHESTAIRPFTTMNAAADSPASQPSDETSNGLSSAWRDTLVVTLRSGSFQQPSI